MARLGSAEWMPGVEDIYQVSLVGNTCMHHLFLGISPASLVHAPYTPAISKPLTLHAADYGIRIHPKGQLAPSSKYRRLHRRRHQWMSAGASTGFEG